MLPCPYDCQSTIGKQTSHSWITTILGYPNVRVMCSWLKLQAVSSIQTGYVVNKVSKQDVDASSQQPFPIAQFRDRSIVPLSRLVSFCYRAFGTDPVMFDVEYEIRHSHLFGRTECQSNSIDIRSAAVSAHKWNSTTILSGHPTVVSGNTDLFTGEQTAQLHNHPYLALTTQGSQRGVEGPSQETVCSFYPRASINFAWRMRGSAGWAKHARNPSKHDASLLRH
jgi:hypothetical protein